jgi:hypothetical protein
MAAGTALEQQGVGRAGSPGVRNFRQALASPQPGIAFVHDPVATPYHQEGAMTRQQWFAGLVLALATAGCAARGVQVAELKNQPTRYHDRTVRISGVVNNSWGIPLVPFQLYSVDDGTGQITVVSHTGRAPAKGTRVQVKGKVNELATLGGQALGLHIEESNRKISR